MALLDMTGMFEFDGLPQASMRIQVNRPADRLRVRKGQVVRYTYDGESRDFIVERVGYPYEFGMCDVDLTAAR